jgi:hypothetical protein
MISMASDLHPFRHLDRPPVIRHPADVHRADARRGGRRRIRRLFRDGSA